MDEIIERIMDICVDALQCEDFDVYGYSKGYQSFTVKTNKGDVSVDFDVDQ